MKLRRTIIASSIFAALCLSATAYAPDNVQNNGAQKSQDTTQNGTTTAGTTQSNNTTKQQEITNLQAINVGGLRAAQALSIETKKAADSHVEVVSAEDIGKLPAKDVADTIAQLPGVNIADAAD